MNKRKNPHHPPRSMLFGIMGWPVGHSLSPYLHNAGFRAAGLNAHYAVFRVHPDNLGYAVLGARSLGIDGINVTVPHKVAVMEFLDEIDKTAQRIGAVNTICIDGEKMIGYNTDGIGFIQMLQKENVSLTGKRVAVIGAGGAARAVVAAAAEEKPKELRIFNRTLEKAEKLAVSLSSPDLIIEAHPLDDASALLPECQICIQSTSIGLDHSSPGPVPLDWVTHDHVVVDLIYNPPTNFLKTAKEKGATAIGGYGMLVYQAAVTFRLWTGIEAPVEEMWRAGEEAMKRC
ncbi:MAG: shikimate dehydrogenase [bacterium]